MKVLLTLLMVFSGTMVHSQSITVKKRYSYNEAITRAEKFFKDKTLTIFATVDHAAAAKAILDPMPPAKLYIFGNPKVGTPLMKDNPVMSLYLPLKLAVYQDSKGDVYYSVPNVTQIGVDETLSKESVEVLLRIDKLLRELAYH
ncbi:MAG: DUF302 domain-containing protein [Brevinema sp.]